MTGTGEGGWDRLGLVFRSQGQRPWMYSHAQMPHAEAVEGSTVRVYFTSRDERNRSHLGWLVFDLERPDRVLDLAVEPLLSPGPIGAFDDCGAMGSWLTVEGGRRRFHYIGWTVNALVPMHLSIGLATGPAEGSPQIEERLAGPVLERNPWNPYYVSCPCIRRDEAGEGWRMWYLSGLAWRLEAGRPPASSYLVWHARSRDGVVWRPDPEPCLELEHPGEIAIARPCVLQDADKWRMWCCHRGETFPYRIGFAESLDGLIWRRRDDQLHLSPSGNGFDSEMTCYPHVFDHGGERWMLYCGDGFGQAGFGLAKAREDRVQ